LDASVEEQRRVREVVAMFSQRETQDELGGRRIVVAIADELFPGTSVLHTRARYLLFVPWFCQRVATHKDPVASLEREERNLIGRFLESDGLSSEDRQGLIGISAGPNVRQLPSTAFWTALSTWEILTWPGSVAETLDRTRHLGRRGQPEDVDELAARSATVWHPAMPPCPPGFPRDTLAGGFELRWEEANWLRERILATAGSSLLSHLLRDAELVDAATPWEGDFVGALPQDLRSVVDDAERFSIAADGARRLFDLMLAEKYVSAGYSAAAVDPAAYRRWVNDWQDDAASRDWLWDGWTSADLWSWVRLRNPNINLLTTNFFDQWFDVARRGSTVDVAADGPLRLVVADRERQTKGPGSARLENDKLLASWGGGAPGPTTFRWTQISRLVNDIVAGLERSDDDAGS
jgi:hypothetical protein